MTRLTAVVLGMALLSASGAAHAERPKQVKHRVEVEGKTYRVTVTGTYVAVAAKRAFVVRTPQEVHRMYEAIRTATGCNIDEETWSSNVLIGQLRCDSVNLSPKPE